LHIERWGGLVDNCKFDTNTAPHFGHIDMIRDTVAVVITHCAFRRGSHTSSVNQGGNLRVQHSSVTASLSNLLIEYGRSNGWCGGLYAQSLSETVPVTLRFILFSNNTA
jgi:hypothetical protein